MIKEYQFTGPSNLQDSDPKTYVIIFAAYTVQPGDQRTNIHESYQEQEYPQSEIEQ